MIRIIITEGERPEALEYQFLDSFGDPIDMTGFTELAAQVRRLPSATSTTVATVTWQDVLEGQALVVWPVPFVPLEKAGAVQVQVWARNPTSGQRLASAPISYRIESVTAAP